MGNEQKGQKGNDVILKMNHPKFQQAKKVNEAGQTRLQITTGADEKEYQKWKSNLEVYRPNQEYLFLPLRNDFKRKGLCGDSGSLTLSFPDYSYLLSEEIYNRKGRNAPFEETELWYLLLILAGAQQQMRRKTNGKVGDIRPENVFLNSDGEAKTSCLLSWPRESTNFSKTFDNEPTYLAPEDMERLEMGKVEDNSNYDSEVFSIGFTVLSAGTLEDFLKLYNTRTYRFNQKDAQILLEEWRANTIYSEVFTALISNLCQFRPDRRLEQQELWGWIQKFQSEIKEKKDFFIQTVPAKVEKEIEENRQRYPAQQSYQPPPQQIYQQEVIPQVQYEQSYPQKSVVEHYNPPPPHFQHGQIPRGYVQQGHQTLPGGYEQYPRPKVEVTSPRGTQPPGFPSPAQRFVNYEQVQGGGIDKKYVIAGDSPTQGRPISGVVRSQYGEVPEGAQFNRTSQFQQIRGSSNEQQLPPQLVGRTVTVSKGGQTETVHHGYVPSYSPEKGKVEGQSNPQYFQQVIDPQGGRFEQTVYVPKSEYPPQVHRPS